MNTADRLQNVRRLCYKKCVAKGELAVGCLEIKHVKG